MVCSDMSQMLVFLSCVAASSTSPSFTIDYDKKTFNRNGQAHQYVSGTMHYFRVLPTYWQDRLWKMKLAGIEFWQFQFTNQLKARIF